MLCNTAFLGLALVVKTLASPAFSAYKQNALNQKVNDVFILQYALTLEHLEAAFYTEGVNKFTSDDFTNLGLAKSQYRNLKRLSKDESTHVTVLTNVLQGLGQNPTAACSYNFSYTDLQSFLDLAAVLEGVGVAAYTGAAPNINSKDVLAAAASIVTIEARHAAVLRLIDNEAPFPTEFDSALDFNQVYTLASQFIVSCPATNPSLGLAPFPTLTVEQMGILQANQTVTLSVGSSNSSSSQNKRDIFRAFQKRQSSTDPASTDSTDGSAATPTPSDDPDPSAMDDDPSAPTSTSDSTSEDGSDDSLDSTDSSTSPSSTSSSAVTPSSTFSTSTSSSPVPSSSSTSATLSPSTNSNTSTSANSTTILPAQAQTQVYAAFLSNSKVYISLVSAALSSRDTNSIRYTTTIPAEVKGQVYVLLVSDPNDISDANTLAGPTIIEVGETGMDANETSAMSAMGRGASGSGSGSAVCSGTYKNGTMSNTNTNAAGSATIHVSASVSASASANSGSGSGSGGSMTNAAATNPSAMVTKYTGAASPNIQVPTNALEMGLGLGVGFLAFLFL